MHNALLEEVQMVGGHERHTIPALLPVDGRNDDEIACSSCLPVLNVQQLLFLMTACWCCFGEA
jgi:hypothetical protein